MVPKVLPCLRTEITRMLQEDNDDSLSWYERNASTGALSYGGMLKDSGRLELSPFHRMEITLMSRGMMMMR